MKMSPFLISVLHQQSLIVKCAFLNKKSHQNENLDWGRNLNRCASIFPHGWRKQKRTIIESTAKLNDYFWDEDIENDFFIFYFGTFLYEWSKQ